MKRCISSVEEEMALATLRDNDRKTFREICRRLDNSYSRNNWKNLLDALYNSKPYRYISHRNYDKFEKFNHGGGSCAYLWLRALATAQPKLKIGSFKEVARKEKRNDIVEHLSEKFKDNKLLAALNDSDLKNLSDILDKSLYGNVSCWKMFASRYGWKADAIEGISQKKEIPARFSPTEMMLNEVINEDVMFSLASFIGCLREIKRNDVIRLIGEFINNQAKKHNSPTTSECTDETENEDETGNENQEETEDDSDNGNVAVNGDAIGKQMIQAEDNKIDIPFYYEKQNKPFLNEWTRNRKPKKEKKQRKEGKVLYTSDTHVEIKLISIVLIFIVLFAVGILCGKSFF